MTGQTINYRQVIAKAIGDAMRENPDVFLMGEDVAEAGGAFKTTAGLLEEFGPRRVRDTPISEQAIVGAALGAAIQGLRPVAEIMFADFAGVAYDQIANQVAKHRYMTGGQVTVPLVIRMANGAGTGFAAQHSQAGENWFLNIPGLKIVVPATVEDLYGLLRSAIDDDDPVLFYEHKALFSLKGELPSPDYRVPLGQARIVREGTDITLVATQQMMHRATQAADELAASGVSVEVIDPRTLVPFDMETVAASFRKTSKLVVVQESPAAGSWGSSLVQRVATEYFEWFDGPPVLLSSPDTPVPYAGNLEEAWLPSVERIVAECRTLAAY